ncbi:MAG: hypothetical protein K0S04_1181 [Herbinix sp.]|jgi:hypothetical protein|nr:hypothetical protein [Herbinix sp.]
MCRFNLILLQEESGEKLLKSEGYSMFYENLLGLKAYQAGYCNCGSFVGSMIEKKGMSYEKALATMKREKLERLYLVRELLYQPNYEEMKESYEQRRDALLQELQPFWEQISNYEMKQMEELEDKFPGDELLKEREELYTRLGDMTQEIELEPEYVIKQEAYQSFLRENAIMNDSVIYYKTKEEEEKSSPNSIPLSELLGFEFEEEMEEIEGTMPFRMIDMEPQSMVIDEVIAREENDTYKSHKEEYEEYRQLFERLLEYTPSLRFATIWSETKELQNVKTVDINSFQIDDLAFLDYNEMVTITK